MKHLESKDLSITEIYSLLIGGIIPRPLALIATTSEKGYHNVSPFSQFNVFSFNPPIVGFSVLKRFSDGSHKDTYENLRLTHECTIQLVTYDMVDQANLSSADYAHEVDEFIKSGLTPIPSDLITSPRVKESPFQMECVLNQIIEFGEDKGAGSLMICEVIKFHVADEVFVGDQIEPELLDAVGCCSDSIYSRTAGETLFEVLPPKGTDGIGYDRLPDFVKSSEILSANNLAQLALIEKIPDEEDVENFILLYEPQGEIDKDIDLLTTFERYERFENYQQMMTTVIRMKSENHRLTKQCVEKTAQVALRFRDVKFAWKALLYEFS